MGYYTCQWGKVARPKGILIPHCTSWLPASTPKAVEYDFPSRLAIRADSAFGLL